MNPSRRPLRTCGAGLALVAIITSGCVTPGLSSEDARVRLLNGKGGSVRVERARIESAGGAPIFCADLTSRSSVLPVVLEWRVRFLDERGMAVATRDTRWEALRLGPGGSEQVQVVPGSSRAVDFVMEIR